MSTLFPHGFSGFGGSWSTGVPRISSNGGLTDACNNNNNNNVGRYRCPDDVECPSAVCVTGPDAASSHNVADAPPVLATPFYDTLTPAPAPDQLLAPEQQLLRRMRCVLHAMHFIGRSCIVVALCEVGVGGSIYSYFSNVHFGAWWSVVATALCGLWATSDRCPLPTPFPPGPPSLSPIHPSPSHNPPCVGCDHFRQMPPMGLSHFRPTLPLGLSLTHIPHPPNHPTTPLAVCASQRSSCPPSSAW